MGKIVSAVFLVFGGLALVAAIFTASNAPNFQYVIGSFIPGFFLVIIGPKIRQESNKTLTVLPVDEDRETTELVEAPVQIFIVDTKRAKAFKWQANLGIIGGIVFMVVAGAVAQNEEGIPTAWIISLTGVACLIWGCVNYIRWKGYSGWFGFFGYLFLLGLVILLCFPNRRKRILKRQQPEEIQDLVNRDRRRGFRFLLVLTPVVIFGIVFGCIIFFAGSSIDAAQWQEFAPEGMGFQVLMPGTPQVEQTSQQTPAGPLEMHKFTVWTKGKHEFFMVIVMAFPEDVGKQLGGERKLLQTSAQDVLVATKGQVRDQREIYLNGWIGLELEISTNGGIVKARIFATKERVYEVWSSVSRIRSRSDDIPKFLNSFKLPQRPRRMELD
jgi:hypothetical protein